MVMSMQRYAYEVKGPDGGTLTSYILSISSNNIIFSFIAITVLLQLLQHIVIKYIPDETYEKF